MRTVDLRPLRASWRPPHSLAALLLVTLGASPPAAAQSQAWLVQYGTSTSDFLQAAAPDGTGGVYVGGFSSGQMGSPPQGGHDAWLARHDAAGGQVWIRQLGSSAADRGEAMAPDGAGGVYLVGPTQGSLGAVNAGSTDAWFVRYGVAGNLIWIRQIGTSATDEAQAAAADGAGGVYVGGWTEGSLGGPNAGFADAWLARYDAAGSQVWIRQLGTSESDTIEAAASDGAGGVYVVGATHGSLGGPGAGSTDAWVARYDAAGNQLWIRQLGTNMVDRARAATLAPDGGVYVAGMTQGNLAAPNLGNLDAFVARYDGAGNLLWTRQLGTPGDEQVNVAVTDAAGGLYLGGGTTGDLGGPNAGGYDGWIARLDHQGDVLWTGQLGTPGTEQVRAAAPDADGGLFVGGITGGDLGGPSAGATDVWLARYDGSPCKAVVYCTAQLTSNGCTPAIGALGAPRKTGGAGSFDVTLSGTRPGKAHVLFYSVNTSAAQTPYFGGFLCMQRPVLRAPVSITAGPGECLSGTQVDFGAVLAAAAHIQPGDVIRAQWWGEDEIGNPSLSDALEILVCP